MRPLFRLSLTVALALFVAGALYGALSPRAVVAAPATLVYPSFGCNTTLQACIDSASISERIIISGGTYITSVTVNKFLWITGDASVPTVIQALPGQRVMTATQGIYLTYLTLSDGQLSGISCPSSCGGALWVTGSGDAALAYVTLQNNSAWKGGGLYADSTGSVALTLVDVVSNTTASDGGGINTTFGPNLQVNSGRIENNRSTSVFGYGGGILADGPVTLDDVDVISNSVTGPGGGVYASSGITTTNGRFERNQAGVGGGAIRTNQNVVIVGTQFISNTADEGGAIHADGALTATSMLVQNNRSTLRGGGGVFINGTAFVSDTQFISNTAAGPAGAIYVRGAATLFASSVASNTAGAAGGGIVVSSTLTADGTDFRYNSAGGRGGGLYVSDTVRLNGGQLVGNNATGVGGGAYFPRFNAFMTDTTVLSNTATAQGGGIYAFIITMTRGIFGNNRALGGTGGAASVVAINVSGTRFISNNASSLGGAVSVLSWASFTNARFERNVSQGSGGALAAWTSGVYNGPLNVNNTDFYSNSASSDGGGAYVGGYGSFSGGRFENNTSVNRDGGGLSGSYLAVTDTVFSNNRVLSDTAKGGAVSGYQLTLNGTQVVNNKAWMAGGGIYASDRLTLTGAVVMSNTVENGKGSGAFAIGATRISGSRFEANITLCGDCLFSGVGGALYVSDTLTMLNSDFIRNLSSGAGGGAYVVSTTVIAGGRFEDNSILGLADGGGLYARGALVISGTQFLRNSARDGGAIYHRGLGAGDNARIVNALFARNTAERGAAVALASGNLATILHSTIAGTTLNPASAIQVSGGTLRITDTIAVNHKAVISQTAGTTSQDYNLFFGNTYIAFIAGGSYASGTHDVFADPLFVNPSSDNYHLTLASPAINAGSNVGVTSDVDGDPRPIGGGFDIGYDEAKAWRVFLPVVVR